MTRMEHTCSILSPTSRVTPFLCLFFTATLFNITLFMCANGPETSECTVVPIKLKCTTFLELKIITAVQEVMNVTD